MTSLSCETPLALISKMAVSGQEEDEASRRPSHVTYSEVPSVMNECVSMSMLWVWVGVGRGRTYGCRIEGCTG